MGCGGCWPASGIPGPPGPTGPTGPAGDAYTKYTADFQDFIDGGTGFIGLVYFPAKTVIENMVLKTSQAFAGVTGISIRALVAPSGNPQIEILQAFNVASAVDSQNLATSKYFYCGGFDNADYGIFLEIILGEGALGDLTAGIVEVWVKVSTLP